MDSTWPQHGLLSRILQKLDCVSEFIVTEFGYESTFSSDMKRILEEPLLLPVPHTPPNTITIKIPINSPAPTPTQIQNSFLPNSSNCGDVGMGTTQSVYILTSPPDQPNYSSAIQIPENEFGVREAESIPEEPSSLDQDSVANENTDITESNCVHPLGGSSGSLAFDNGNLNEKDESGCGGMIERRIQMKPCVVLLERVEEIQPTTLETPTTSPPKNIKQEANVTGDLKLMEEPSPTITDVYTLATNTSTLTPIITSFCTQKPPLPVPMTTNPTNHLILGPKAYSSRFGRRQGRNSGEKPEKPKRFVCDFCPARFLQKINLITHRMTHTGEKPYICEICGRAFRQLSAKNSHKILHAVPEQGNLPPHKCDLCPKRFTKLGYLTKHKQIHTKPQTTTNDPPKSSNVSVDIIQTQIVNS